MSERGNANNLDSVLARLDIGICWEWTGETVPGGYGRVNVNGRRFMVHRYVWESLVAPIPEGLTIDHVCRNAKCANPDHLEVVTMQENLARRPRPGRKPQSSRYRGHAHGDSYLNKRGYRNCRVCRRQNYQAKAAVRG